MRARARSITLCFGAGALGGLASSAALWASGDAGLTAALGVAIAPAWTPPWLYRRVVWGGLWGLLFLLPLGGRRWVARGALLSVAPSLVQLCFVFPFVGGRGLLGLELGALTPLFVLGANAVWGLVASGWLRVTGR